jgi:hypothetical protein
VPAHRDAANTMTPETAHAVYDALVEHGGAIESHRERFVHSHTTRFHGGDKVVYALGPGGKFRRTAAIRGDGTYGEHWYVDGYPEDYTPTRRAVIATLAPILDALRVRHETEHENTEQATNTGPLA